MAQGNKERGHPPNTSILHSVFLTFDGGPTPGTEQVLNALEGKDVPATFFISSYRLDPDQWGGTRARNNRQRLERIANTERHVLGNHSYSDNPRMYPLADGEPGTAQEHNNPPGRMVEDFEKNVRELVEFFNGMDRELPWAITTYIRLPAANTWRIPGIDCRDEPIKSEGANRDPAAVADHLVRDGYKVFGWDVEWTEGSRPEEVAKETVRKLRRKETMKEGKAVIRLRDSLFKESRDNAPQLVEMIDRLVHEGKENDMAFTFYTLLHY